jgi:hypothetical protein
MTSLMLLFLVMSSGIVGYWVGRISNDRRQLPALPPPSESLPLLLPPSLGVPYQINDVLVAPHGEEAVLQSAWVLTEQSQNVASIFWCLGAGTPPIIVAFPEERKELFWLRPVAVAVPESLPSTLEVEGDIFEMRRRIPVKIQAVSRESPDEHAMFAEYFWQNQRVVVVWGAGSRSCTSWRGMCLPTDTVEHYPSDAEQVSSFVA